MSSRKNKTSSAIRKTAKPVQLEQLEERQYRSGNQDIGINVNDSSAAGVANFWRRMATEDAASVTARQSHPTTPERFLAIEKTYAEISAKKKAHKPLVPNFK